MIGGEVTIEQWDPDQIAAASDAIREIFAGAFGDTAEEAAGYIASLATHSTRPDFRFVAAREDGRLIGFIYGYSSAPGQWFHDLLRRTIDPLRIRRWLNSAFEVVEFAVQSEAQGRGIGGKLHDTLLSGLANRTAILATDQGETAAMRLYRGRGWQIIEHDYRFPNHDQPRVIMGRDLTGL